MVSVLYVAVWLNNLELGKLTQVLGLDVPERRRGKRDRWLIQYMCASKALLS
ncbi:hypothetical protein [Myxacorys almedinensis]|uniref:Uncharacterized protein n=1 Tax=Myxacorys almedinensis A TaxID=2690445 RepID=A0A8J8CLW1_9CYAN|nr:hypothetical protein [Myxacorys almedinensis]NDJ16547.1 hypothetical protein [Myxacorys almedinensis A]